MNYSLLPDSFHRMNLLVAEEAVLDPIWLEERSAANVLENKQPTEHKQPSTARLVSLLLCLLRPERRSESQRCLLKATGSWILPLWMKGELCNSN